MSHTKNPHNSCFSLGLAVLVVALAGYGWGATEKVLHHFGAAGDGYNPEAPLTFDSRGNLYGTTLFGGNYGCLDIPGTCGFVFQLVPNADGTWTENLIHTFTAFQGGVDSNPVLVDSRGTLYGACPCGYRDCSIESGGWVFRLTPASDGSWIYNIVESFDVLQQRGPVALGIDPADHLYGTLIVGGYPGYGTVYFLAQVSALNYYYIVAYNFAGPPDGDTPIGPLAFDTDGNIYGATQHGGASLNGTVFKLTPNHNHFGWTETILHSFTGQEDGGQPTGVVIDGQGNLYGTTSVGGQYSLGSIFKLTPNPDGTYTETVLYSFTGGSDGENPLTPPSIDAAGNLYGTLPHSGSYGKGMVYELLPAGGQGQFTALYSFTGGADGGTPDASVILDSAGNLYGTTREGGIYEGGVAYEIMR